MEIDFKSAAMEFVRQHKFSMPLQDVQEAMEAGAELALGHAAKRVKTARVELEKQREKNLKG